MSDFELVFFTPLPPPDNHRIGTHGGRHFASARYKEWIGIARDRVEQALPEGWVPDTEHWWDTRLSLLLPSMATDGPNYAKAILDLLSGLKVVEKDYVDEKGTERLRGTIQRTGLLWDDDNRTHLTVTVASVRDPKPGAVVVVRRLDYGPLDIRAMIANDAAAAVERRRQERLAVAEAKRAEKERKAVEREYQRSARAAAKALRKPQKKAVAVEGEVAISGEL